MFHMLLNTFIFGLAPPSIEEGFNEGKSNNNEGSEDARNDDFFVQDYSDATVMYFDNAMWDEHFEADKKLTEKLFETIQPGTLILSKEPIAHTLGHKKYVDLPTSYNWSRGYALIFLAIEP